MHGLTKALAARGHEVTIATVDKMAGRTTGGTRVPTPEGVALETFACDSSPRYAQSSKLDEYLRSHVGDFDIVHLHSLWQFPTFAAARACRQAN